MYSDASFFMSVVFIGQGVCMPFTTNVVHLSACGCSYLGDQGRAYCSGASKKTWEDLKKELPQKPADPAGLVYAKFTFTALQTIAPYGEVTLYIMGRYPEKGRETLSGMCRNFHGAEWPALPLESWIPKEKGPYGTMEILDQPVLFQELIAPPL
jgi:hypothetical protein